MHKTKTAAAFAELEQAYAMQVVIRQKPLFLKIIPSVMIRFSR